MKKILVLILLISLGLNISLGVRTWKDSRRLPMGEQGWNKSGKPAPGGGDGPGHGRNGTFWREVMHRRLAHVADQLGLDEEQAVAFQNTHEKAAEGFLTQRSKVQEARRQLMEAVSGPDFGEEKLRPLIAEVGRQQVKLDSMVTETMLQEMEILTSEQRKEYLRILPINRFGGSGGGHRNRSENRSGHRSP
jgi:Spy/CpxP family protein refolding chaperone